MFPLHTMIGSGQVSFSSLNIMPCIYSTLYAMLILACREIPLLPNLLVARCRQNGGNPKAFLVARLLTQMRTIPKPILLLCEGITSNSILDAFAGIWDCGWDDPCP